MKTMVLYFGALLAAMSLHAQVTLELKVDQEQFLPAEALPVTALVVNRSGQTLHLGDEGWLRFMVEANDGGVVAKLDEPAVNQEFALPSSKQGRVKVDLAPCFNLRKPGRYTVTAVLQLKDWNQTFKSAPVAFDIIQGSELWQQQVGVPAAANATNEPPVLRRYSLHQANYLRKQLMLYVEVADGNGRIRKVFPVGRMLSFGQPEPQVDRLSNLHLLYQDGPRAFNYTVVNPDGELVLRQRYDYTTRPRLKVDSDGNITVVGGTRRIMSSDLPPPKTAEDNATTRQP